VSNTGCKLCYKPVFGSTNVGNRPVCKRFAGSEDMCHDEHCCVNHQNANTLNGNGFLEFDDSCLNGGLNCVGDSGCKLCYKPVFGSTNVGNRPVCKRFVDLNDLCRNEQCCINHQNPNPSDGNGYLEFVSSCLNGGLNCVSNTGCKLCYKPVIGGTNVGNRPVCTRFM